MSKQLPQYPFRDKVLEISRKIVEISDIVQFGSIVQFNPELQIPSDARVHTKQLAGVIGVHQIRDHVSIDFRFELFIRVASDADANEDQSDEDAFAASPFLVKALYRIGYKLSDENQYEDQELAAFGSVNSHFNLTSYWREFLASACARANFSPILVQPFDAARALAGVDDLVNTSKTDLKSSQFETTVDQAEFEGDEDRH